MRIGLLLWHAKHRAALLQRRQTALTRPFPVEDPATAALFADPLRRRLLLLLAARELSLSGLAEATGARLNLIHYHVARLLSAGLVGIVREAPRAGRPVRYYRAAHSAFFVPDAALAERPGRQLARDLETALDAARARGGGGTVFELDRDGRPRMRRVEEEQSGASETWRLLRLDPRDAALLAEELAAVIRRYEARAAQARTVWIVHAALARREG